MDSFYSTSKNTFVKNSTDTINKKAPETHYNSKYRTTKDLTEIQKLNIKIKELEAVNRECENELVNVKSMNKKFISVLAHDLRSPFNSILNSLEIVKEGINQQQNHELSIYADHAINSANIALNLLDNLLIWIVSQQNGENIKPVRFNLRDILLEALKETEHAAAKKKINITHCIEDNVFLSADLQMVKSILRNLISNAIKFSNEYGEITVSVRTKEQNIEITIEDNGIGISIEAQKKLFKIDSFHSTPGTNSERGTGLGLLICKDFIELHGGNIWLESEPGNGSLVKFSLPQYY